MLELGTLGVVATEADRVELIDESRYLVLFDEVDAFDVVLLFFVLLRSGLLFVTGLLAMSMSLSRVVERRK